MMRSYKYACELNLVDAGSMVDTDMLVPISRIEAARMLSEFARNVFLIEPNSTQICEYTDMGQYSDRDKIYAQTVCQMGIMGLEFDGRPAQEFNPSGLLTRAEFGTIFSRMLFGDTYNGDAEVRYRPHLSALQAAGIMTKIDEPYMLEQK